MAAYYIKEIRTIQSDGPYFIGGSGAGCTIALEIAHQLQSQGQNVTLLALFIPSNPKPTDLKPTDLKPNRSPKIFSEFFRKYIRLSKLYFSLLIIVVKSRLLLPTIKHFLLNRVLWHLKICRRFIPGEIHRMHRFGDAFSNAVKSYEPKAYQGRIVCFLNDEFSHNHKRRHNHKRHIDDWYDLAVGGLDVRLVPGDTFTMWREPHVQKLADQFKASLDEALTDNKEFTDTKN
jgi:thioesterase domain-containing protein